MMNEYFELLSSEQQKAVYEKLGVTEEIVKNDVKHLKEWLKKQQHLPNLEDEEILQNVLLRFKMSLEKTKHSIEGYFIFRATFDKLFQIESEDFFSRNDIKEFFKLRFHSLYLPKLTTEGYRVSVYRMNENYSNQTENLNFSTILTLFIYFTVLKIDANNGVLIIVDLKGFTMSHSAFLISRLSVIGYIMKFISTRVRKVYILNLSPMTQKLINLTKALMTKAMNEKIVIWNRKIEELAHEITGNVLPPIYGGTENSLEDLNDRFYEYMTRNQDWLFKISQLKANLSKIPANNEIGKEIAEFGMSGSFRRLVD